MNCRNTHEITERVAAVYGEKVSTLGVRGPKPLFLQIKRRADARDRVLELVERLLREEGFDPRQLTVLVANQSIRELFDDSAFGRRTTGARTANSLTVETVETFAGLESDVVVLVLDDIETDLDRAVAYTGMSRARALLAVVGSKQARAALNWD